MKIFNDKFYENPNNNAFLNWRTDAPEFSAFYELGAGFLSSSIITLQAVIRDCNESDEADNLIFPIMFNLWHGIELMLKSGIILIRDIYKRVNMNDLKSHKIDELYIKFENELNLTKLTKPQKDLISLKELLDEFKTEDVNFDAFRYPSDNKWQGQFYNKKINCENKCICLTDLQIKCLEIIETLPRVIKYFDDTIISDGNDVSYISDATYEFYTKDDLFKETDYDKDDDPTELLLKALRYIM